MMKRNSLSLGIIGILIYLLTLGGVGGSVQAADQVQKWNVQAIFPSGSSLYKEFVNFTENVKMMTGGRLVITPHPLGAIVGYKEMHSSLKTGVLQGYYSAPTFQSGKEPAFSIICDLPGGYENVMQFDTWVYEKGGIDFLREAQAKFGYYAVGAIFYGREVMPSKVPIRSMNDMKGKKVRAPEGIIAKLMTALGASTVSIPGSEVYSALDKGVIQATDWGTRSMNNQMGFYEVCKYSIEPGFHSMSLLEFTVSQKAWDKLPPDVQQTVEVATRAWSWAAVTRIMKEDAEAGVQLKNLGVEIISFPEEDYKKIREISRGLWEEWAAKSELSRRVVDSHIAWSKELGLLN
jgi:TRAP-type mannitol/chloroaromatic compound transport system substrate-binding protein